MSNYNNRKREKKSMKTSTVLILIAVVVAIAVAGVFIFNTVRASNSVAKINNTFISVDEYKFFVNSVKKNMESSNGLSEDAEKAAEFWADEENVKKLKDDALTEAKNWRLQSNKGRELRLVVDESLLDQLKAEYNSQRATHGPNVDDLYFIPTYGVSYRVYSSIMQDYLYAEAYVAHLESNSEVSEEEAQTKFDEMKKEGDTTLASVRHILFPKTNEQGEEIKGTEKKEQDAEIKKVLGLVKANPKKMNEYVMEYSADYTGPGSAAAEAAAKAAEEEAAATDEETDPTIDADIDVTPVSTPTPTPAETKEEKEAREAQEAETKKNAGVFSFFKTGAFEDNSGAIVTEFTDWAFKDGRKVGDIDKITSEFGTHIVKLEDKVEKKFEDLKENIMNTLKSEKMQAKMTELVESQQDNIKVFDNVINNLQVV